MIQKRDWMNECQWETWENWKNMGQYKSENDKTNQMQLFLKKFWVLSVMSPG